PVRESRPVVPARTAPELTATPAARDGLSPLPRRVPQTSLAAELREEIPSTEEEDHPDDFTAERAASSLACFQRGTFQARDESDHEAPHAPKDEDQRVPATRGARDGGADEGPSSAGSARSASSTSCAPPADRS
ncbi:histidine kinase, partial [Streptomyces sp. NPDC006356]